MLKTLYGINLLDAFGLSIILPLINSRIVALGGSLMWVGIIQSASAGAQLFGSPVVGSWSDTRGRKTLLIYTLVVTLLSNVLVGVPSLAVFFLSRILFGLSHHTDVLVRTMIADKLPPNEVSKSSSQMGAIGALAFMTGPILGGALYEKFQNYYVISILLSSLTVLLIVVSYITVEETVKLEKVTEATQKTISERVLEDLGNVFKGLKTIDLEKYGDLLLTKLLAEAVFSTIFMNINMILMTNFGFKHIDIGFVIAFFSMSMIPTSLSMSYIFKTFYKLDKTGLQRAFHGFATLVTVICLLPFATTSALYITLITIAIAVKIMLDALLMEILSARTTETDKGVIMGANTSMISLSGLVCPLISGAVGSFLGPLPLILLPIIPSLAGIILVSYLKQTAVVDKDKKS